MDVRQVTSTGNAIACKGNHLRVNQHYRTRTGVDSFVTSQNVGKSNLAEKIGTFFKSKSKVAVLVMGLLTAGAAYFGVSEHKKCNEYKENPLELYLENYENLSPAMQNIVNELTLQQMIENNDVQNLIEMRSILQQVIENNDVQNRINEMRSILDQMIEN